MNSGSMRDDSTRWSRPHLRPVDRIAAAFLLVLMVLGSLTLWIGVPIACLWLSAKLADSLATHFLIVLPMSIAAMVAWGAALFWVNAIYLRVTGLYTEPEDPEEPPRPLRGPLEPILVGSLVLALVALVVWFFGFAQNPSPQVI